MKHIVREFSSNLSLVSTIRIDYFNKRKLDFEPVLEPWKFKVTIDNK